MFSKTVVTAGLATALLLTPFSAPASASSPAPSDRITLEVVSVMGSGCPSGTMAVAASPDNTAFTVTYSDYLAQVGVGAEPTDWRKNCQLGIKVNVPQGFTYGVAQADYRGFASLEKGSTGTQVSSYYFQGSQNTSKESYTFNGPLSDSWQRSDTREISEMEYAPCGVQRILNVNTELRVRAGTSDTKSTTSFMTMDSIDGAASTTYHFAWKQCPGA
ncbi:MAG: hypothetical protein QG622_1136 [Actinomycetota bacterium]|nr:hypothetical protein [Actinomycetota bacterium]